MKARTNPKEPPKMPQKRWQISPIDLRAAECQGYLDEAAQTDDLDLMEELAAKMNDAMLVYRRKGRPVPPKPSPPEAFTFSDGVTRNVDVMAFSHAMEQVNEELDEASQWPAWMMRGENHA